MFEQENGVFMPNNAPSTGSVSFKFTGQAGEYFRIWIVNICLTLVTLGIYSAWAKVRRKRYFYGNTLLNEAGFDYLADPKAILRGRLIAVAVLALVSLLNTFVNVDIFALLYLLLIPFIVIKSAIFNANNSAYRNVRFKFGVGFAPKSTSFGLERITVRGYNQTSQFLILPAVLLPLSMGLLYPYYVFRKRQFFLQHSAFGKTDFWFDGTAGAFYRAYAKVAGVALLLIVASGVSAKSLAPVLLGKLGPMMMGVALLALLGVPLFSWVRAYHDATVGRLSWQHSGLGKLRFDCQWQSNALFQLYVVNHLAILFSLGLLIPWANIRTARYQIEGLSLSPASALNDFVATEIEQVSALGDEAGELVDWDFGL